jgi:hypothetical protein
VRSRLLLLLLLLLLALKQVPAAARALLRHALLRVVGLRARPLVRQQHGG